MARKKRTARSIRRASSGAGGTRTADYRHKRAKRRNIPPAKIAAEGTVPAIPKAQYAYSPRLSPVLRFDAHGGPDRLPKLLDKATRGKLTPEEARLIAEAHKQGKTAEVTRLNTMDAEQRRAIAKTYYAHNLDQEPSPLEDYPPGKLSRKVKEYKRL